MNSRFIPNAGYELKKKLKENMNMNVGNRNHFRNSPIQIITTNTFKGL